MVSSGVLVVIEFIDDCKTLPLSKMREKYEFIFSGVPIKVIVNEGIRARGGLEDLIKPWKGDGTDRAPFYLVQNEYGYEVFSPSDRGGRENVECFTSLESAAFEYFDRYLSELMCLAPDSRINAGKKESPFILERRLEKLREREAENGQGQ